MEFKDQKGIFRQIADSLCDKIVSGELQARSRVPSVRELAATVGVNQNTIMRAYTELERENIISNQRGIGFFVADEAYSQIINLRKQEFFSDTLPEFLRQVTLLNLSNEEIKPIVEQLNQVR